MMDDMINYTYWMFFPVFCVCALDAIFIYVVIESKKLIHEMIINEQHTKLIFIVILTSLSVFVLSVLNVVMMLILHEKILVSLNNV